MLTWEKAICFVILAMAGMFVSHSHIFYVTFHALMKDFSLILRKLFHLSNHLNSVNVLFFFLTVRKPLKNFSLIVRKLFFFITYPVASCLQSFLADLGGRDLRNGGRKFLLPTLSLIGIYGKLGPTSPSAQPFGPPSLLSTIKNTSLD